MSETKSIKTTEPCPNCSCCRRHTFLPQKNDDGTVTEKHECGKCGAKWEEQVSRLDWVNKNPPAR